MKSVLQAGWLCTNAVGNIIVLIVAELGKLPKQVLLTSDLTQVTYTLLLDDVRCDSLSVCVCSGRSMCCFLLCWWLSVSSFLSWRISTNTSTQQRSKLRSRENKSKNSNQRTRRERQSSNKPRYKTPVFDGIIFMNMMRLIFRFSIY